MQEENSIIPPDELEPSILDTKVEVTSNKLKNHKTAEPDNILVEMIQAAEEYRTDIYIRYSKT